MGSTVSCGSGMLVNLRRCGIDGPSSGMARVNAVAFSPDGRLVAVGGEVGERAKERKAGEIHLWDIES